MLSFVQSWFSPGANPVGVDFGTESLRLAQVEKIHGDYRLIAAASAEVPADIRDDESARLEFLGSKLRELWISGNFRGRRVVLTLPAASMYVQHLRLPRMDDESIKKALPWESQGKIPIDPAKALLRHLVAGEIYQNQEPCHEIILLAARRTLVDDLLAAANKARLDVVGMNVEPRALVDCFLQIYRRKSDAESTNCFVDIGSGASRAVIARGGHILFARNIPVGGEQFNWAVAEELGISLAEARAVRIKLASAPENPADDIEPPNQSEDLAHCADVQSPAGETNVWRQEQGNDRRSICVYSKPLVHTSVFDADGHESDEGHGAIVVATRTTVRSVNSPAATERQAVGRAVSDLVTKLAEELSLCRRYHEAAFPEYPLERLIFVGGEAKQRELCQQVARKLRIAAQIGDPLVRMGRTTEIGIESGIDRRQPQPAWAVAIGLSMGSPGSNPT